MEKNSCFLYVRDSPRYNSGPLKSPSKMYVLAKFCLFLRVSATSRGRFLCNTRLFDNLLLLGNFVQQLNWIWTCQVKNKNHEKKRIPVLFYCLLNNILTWTSSNFGSLRFFTMDLYFPCSFHGCVNHSYSFIIFFSIMVDRPPLKSTFNIKYCITSIKN